MSLMLILQGDREVELKTDLEKLLAAALKATVVRFGGDEHRLDLPRYAFHDVVFQQHDTLQIMTEGEERDIVRLVKHL